MVCFDAADYLVSHDTCANRCDGLQMEDIYQAAAQELNTRPVKTKPCIAACTMTLELIVEEPSDKEEE